VSNDHQGSGDGLHHLPLDGFAASWVSAADSPEQISEQLLVHFENEAWTIEGIVTTTNPASTSVSSATKPAPETTHYVLRLSATWHVQQMLLFRDLEEPDLWLATDGRGVWGEVNGAHRRELGGCDDIDIRTSALTRTLAIRRLESPIGACVDVHSIVVDPETLAITRARLNYTRLNSRLWSVHRDDGLPIHEFTVDDYGFPLDIPGYFRRVS
jgi:hypothetical protein